MVQPSHNSMDHTNKCHSDTGPDGVNNCQAEIAINTDPAANMVVKADYAVIGRSVTRAHDPVETMEKIKKTLAFKLVSEKL